MVYLMWRSGCILANADATGGAVRAGEVIGIGRT